MNHPAPELLALYAGGDAGLWQRLELGIHVHSCSACAAEVRALREASLELKTATLDVPMDSDWERLAAEMGANIRLGLAAGAIVGTEDEAAGPQIPREAWSWRLAVVAASMCFVMGAGWMLRVPRPAQISRAAFFLETNRDGLALRDHGAAMTLLNPEKTTATTTVSWDGGARASYIDTETGQVTIHHVSAE